MYTWLVNLEEWFWVRVKWVRESAMTVPSPLAALSMYWVRVDDQVNRSDTGPSSGPQGRGWVLTIWHQASIGFPTARCNTRQGQLYYLHHHIVPPRPPHVLQGLPTTLSGAYHITVTGPYHTVYKPTTFELKGSTTLSEAYHNIVTRPYHTVYRPTTF